MANDSHKLCPQGYDVLLLSQGVVNRCLEKGASYAVQNSTG